jgi:PPOX class probable F420-dependent enzyme
MDEATMRRRVAAARVGRLATVTAGGGPHVVPCCFALDGARIVSAVDAKPKTTPALRRLANLRVRPRAALLVDHYDEDWSQLWWVRVDGAGRVVDAGAERDQALDLLAAKYDQYARQRPPGAVVVIEVDGWRSWEASP